MRKKEVDEKEVVEMIKQQTAEWTTTDPPTLYITRDSFPQLILSSKSPIPQKYHKQLQEKIDEMSVDQNHDETRLIYWMRKCSMDKEQHLVLRHGIRERIQKEEIRMEKMWMLVVEMH